MSPAEGEENARLWLQFRRLLHRVGPDGLVILASHQGLHTLSIEDRQGRKHTASAPDLAEVVAALVGALPRRERPLTEQEHRRLRFEATARRYERRHGRPRSAG